MKQASTAAAAIAACWQQRGRERRRGSYILYPLYPVYSFRSGCKPRPTGRIDRDKRDQISCRRYDRRSPQTRFLQRFDYSRTTRTVARSRAESHPSAHVRGLTLSPWVFVPIPVRYGTHLKGLVVRLRDGSDRERRRAETAPTQLEIGTLKVWATVAVDFEIVP